MRDSEKDTPWLRRMKKRAVGRYPLMSAEAELRRYKTGLEEIHGKIDRILAALSLPETSVVKLPKRKAKR